MTSVTRRDWVTELGRLLDNAGLTLTFDRFRDITKGCGSHCKAMYPYTSVNYCTNHEKGIRDGEYDLDNQLRDTFRTFRANKGAKNTKQPDGGLQEG
jgi:hypothetical protein